MKMLTALLLLAVTATAYNASAAKLYKWVDKRGNVSYQDMPPPPEFGGKVEQREVEGEVRNNSGADPALAAAVAQSPVVLYTIPKCAQCNLVRTYLNNRKVPFTEKNAASDLTVQEELRKKSGALSVPTVAIGAKIITEYSQAWLQSELDQAGYPDPKAGASETEGDASSDK